MKKDNNKDVWNALTMVLQFGINMIVPICLCTFVGIWLGKKIEAEWIVIPLFFVGALAGFTNIYKLSRRFFQKEEQNKDVKKD